MEFPTNVKDIEAEVIVKVEYKSRWYLSGGHSNYYRLPNQLLKQI